MDGPKISRRGFAIGGGVAAGLAPHMRFVSPALAYTPAGDETRARYRESAHVQTFYRVNGYETLKKSKP